MALPSIPQGPNLSRRFVLGGAAATLVAPEGLDSAKAEDAPAAAMPDMASITLNVNGVDQRSRSEPTRRSPRRCATRSS